MAEALVEFDYKAQESDELTIKKGDIITDISCKPGGWWEGTLSRTGKRGMFPDNFVKLMTDAEGETVHHPQPQRKCKVLFHYKPVNEDELELQVGDIIDVLSEVEEGWWKGKLKNKVGVFPSNFVIEIAETKNEVREATQRKPKLSRDDSTKQPTSLSQEQLSINSPPQSGSNSQNIMKTSSNMANNELSDLPKLPPKPVKEICRAMYNYEAENADELSLNEGDLVTIISKEGEDIGWWKGELKGKTGVFPENFVQILTTVEEIKPDRPSKCVARNKMRDLNITKSATTSNVVGNLSDITRKFSEPNKPVGKKPVLPPPPMKKPQRSSSDLSKSPTAPSLLSSKLVETAGSLQQIPNIIATRSTTSLTNTASSAQNTADIVTSSTSSITSTGGRWSVHHESSSTTLTNSSMATSNMIAATERVNDKTDGLLWSKHKTTSYVVNSSSSQLTESNSVTVNTSGGDVTTASSSQQLPSELDLDLVGRAAMLTHPTATRAKLPKRRPPSGVINKDVSLLTDSNFEIDLDDDMKNGDDSISTFTSGGISATTEVQPPVLINGDADSHMMESVMVHSRPAMPKPPAPWAEERSSLSKTAPWVEELKLSQAKKSMQAGKTRVMIGGPSPTMDNVPSPPGDTVASTTSKLQQITTTSSIMSSSTSTSSMMSTSLIGAVTLRSSNSSAGQPRPQSMVSSLRSSIGSSEGLLGPASSASPSSNTSPQDTVTVTLRQWTELNDKLSRLESHFETQLSTLTKTVKDLTGKLDEEKQRRLLLQQELEKLTDLVTQV